MIQDAVRRDKALDAFEAAKEREVAGAAGARTRRASRPCARPRSSLLREDERRDRGAEAGRRRRRSRPSRSCRSASGARRSACTTSSPTSSRAPRTPSPPARPGRDRRLRRPRRPSVDRARRPDARSEENDMARQLTPLGRVLFVAVRPVPARLRASTGTGSSASSPASSRPTKKAEGTVSQGRLRRRAGTRRRDRPPRQRAAGLEPRRLAPQPARSRSPSCCGAATPAASWPTAAWRPTATASSARTSASRSSCCRSTTSRSRATPSAPAATRAASTSCGRPSTPTPWSTAASAKLEPQGDPAVRLEPRRRRHRGRRARSRRVADLQGQAPGLRGGDALALLRALRAHPGRAHQPRRGLGLHRLRGGRGQRLQGGQGGRRRLLVARRLRGRARARRAATSWPPPRRPAT